eukprot:scaffold1307_cov151-Amphora_coffeaeformis.AAC.14
MTAWKKISFVLLALVIGVAMAWIRPAQPKQVETPAMPNFARKTSTLLDNDDIPLENGIHNSRKCGFCMGVSQLSFVYDQVQISLLNDLIRTDELPSLRSLGPVTKLFVAMRNQGSTALQWLLRSSRSSTGTTTTTATAAPWRSRTSQ